MLQYIMPSKFNILVNLVPKVCQYILLSSLFSKKKKKKKKLLSSPTDLGSIFYYLQNKLLVLHSVYLCYTYIINTYIKRQFPNTILDTKILIYYSLSLSLIKFKVIIFYPLYDMVKLEVDTLSFHKKTIVRGPFSVAQRRVVCWRDDLNRPGFCSESCTRNSTLGHVV